MTRLQELENKSIFILREAATRYENPALLWSMGKDSTVLLWLAKKAFFGKVPFPVIHIDTGFKFREMISFRDRYAKEWGLNLVIGSKETDVTNTDKFKCCMIRKTQALMDTVQKNEYDALIVGIRRDEHGIRNKERYFSPRDKDFAWKVSKEKENPREGDSPLESLQEPEFSEWNLFQTDFGKETDHVRIHPLLEWDEQDIWEYIHQEKIPTVPLYYSADGKTRYRSLGCKCCCSAVASAAKDTIDIIEELKSTTIKERDGRDQDKEDEYMMQKLRSLGYM